MKTPYTHEIIVALVALALPMLAHAQEPIVLTANDAAGTTSFNTAGHWSNAQAPSGANEYNSTNLLRTPGDANNYTFQGHSLTLGVPASYANGDLIYKGSAAANTYTINNLTNAGGLIRSGSGSGNTMTLAGNLMTITANSTIEPDQSPFIISLPLAGGDGMVLTNIGTLVGTYTGTNSAFTGEFFLGGNNVTVFGNVNSVPGNPSTPNPSQITLSSGSSLNDTAGVVLNNSNGGITLLGSATINNTLTTVIAVPIAIYTNLSTLTKNGAGLLVLSNAFNTYSNTTISAGTLQIGVANALPPHNVTDNGTLDLNGFSTTIDGIAGSGIVDTVSGGTPTLTIGVTGGLGTLTGTIRNTAGALALTKVGAGTETLSGGYTYSGPTLVAGGTLILTTAASLPSTAGSLAVSNGAVLTVNATNGTPLPASGVTLGTNVTLNLNLTGAASGINAAGGLAFQDNAAINLNYGTIFANPTVAAINAAGGISAPGSNIVINITAIGVKTGQFPLIKYTGASLGSIANFSLGSLPPGVTATLANNTGEIDLNISATPRQITWSGVNGTSWDTSTVNWTNSDGTATAYRQITNGTVIAGDSVTFDNTLTNSIPQPTNVNLTAVFYPFPVVVNSTLPYSLGGAGGLAGSSGNTGIAYLTKNNTSSLTLLTSNSFTGGLLINSGSVVVTNDFSLGANSSVVTLNGGNLQVNGNTTNNARAFSVPTASNIGVLTNVTAQFGGAVTGAGGLTKTDNGTLVLAGSNGITGALTVNQGTLTTLGTNILAAVPVIGNAVGFSGLLNISGGVFQANNNGGSVSSSSLTIGNVAGAAGDVVMSSGTLTVNRQLTVGPTDYGAFSQSGGTTTIGGFIACGGQGDGGVFNQSGGTVNMTNSSATIGYSTTSSYGVMNLSGNAVFNMIGAGNGMWPGEVGNGTLNVSGNAALTITSDGVALGRNTGTGTVNLNGGTIAVNFITNGPVAGTFNFNGGTLKANTNSASFTKGAANQTAFYVYNGGATIDDGGNAITFSQPLQAPTGYGVASIPVPPGTSSGYIDSPIVIIADQNGYGSNATANATISGGVITGIVITCPGSGFNPVDSYVTATFFGGGPNAVPPEIDPTTTTIAFSANSTGGLTKKGSGTLTMSGQNSFAGAVNVNAGTLSLTTASTLTGSTTVTNGSAFVIEQKGSATGSISNLTFNGGAAVPGATLGLGISAANNATVPLLKCGVFTLNGTNSINLAGALNVGTISLVQYVGALAGSGTITNLILPQGDAGFISNSVVSSTLYAIITSTGPGLVWSGTNSGVASLTNLWDIGSTTNWLLGSASTTYHQPIAPGDAVTFNDNGSGTVILNTNASPSSLVISNNSKSYTIKGVGSVSGLTGLQKLGSGTSFLNLTNDSYTGDTVISNGALQVGNPTALSSAANLNVGPGGTLELNGLGQLAGATAASGSVAGLSGSGIIDNNNSQNVTLIVGSGSGGTWNGTIQDHGAGGVSLQKVGNNTLVIGGTNHLDDGSLTGYSSVDQGTMIITNGGMLKIPYAQFYVGSIAGSSGTNIVAGGMLVLSNNLLAVGRTSATDNGTPIVSGTLIVNSGTVQKAGANNIVVGSTGGNGTLIVNGGQVLNNGALWLGDGSGAVGTLNLNGGLIQATGVIPNNSPATSTAYFNGGTLQATTNSASFLQVTCEVMGGGLILDDNGYTLGITAAALQAGILNDGGFTKKGAGTVYLDAVNAYNGITTVMNGTLAGIGSVNGSVLVTPAGKLGAGDAAAVGTFTIANGGNLTLQGNATLRINKTGGTKTQDNVAVSGIIAYGGTLTVNNITSDSTALAVGDTFQLFSVTGATSGNFSYIAGIPGPGMAYSFNPATGVLSVVASAGPGTFTSPTGITSFQLNGANVMLNGTNGQAGGGYYLLQSTNVALPLSQWKVVATNVLSTNGNYTFIGTNVVTSGVQQQFYILSNTNSNH